MIKKFKNNLKNINLLFFDCGMNDEFNLFIGAKVFSERCKSFGISHEYLQYDGGHFNTSFRYATSLSNNMECYRINIGIDMIRRVHALYWQVRFDFRIVDNWTKSSKTIPDPLIG